MLFFANFVRTLLLTWLCVQATAVEKVSSKDDVDVTEEKQNVSSFPCSGTHVQTSASGKLLVQVDHREVTEIQLSDSKKIKREVNYILLWSGTHYEPLIYSLHDASAFYMLHQNSESSHINFKTYHRNQGIQ